MKPLCTLLALVALAGCTFRYSTGQGFSLQPTHNIGFTPVNVPLVVVEGTTTNTLPNP